MKLLRKFTAFILAFCLLAGTVAVMSAAVYDDKAISESAAASESPSESATEALKKDALAMTAASSYTPRLSAPAKTNRYYYSDDNVFYKYGYGMPNCTCYAWGRAYEITGKIPQLCVYSAYLWYDYNKNHQIYSYGQTPKLGAIACWVYSSGNAGHVAVVERITDTTVTFSNSAYSGIEFYTNTTPIDDPSDVNETWNFQGYIYIGEFTSTVEPTETPAAGTSTTRTVYRITSSDGVNFRKGAGTGYASLGVIPKGAELTVTATKKAEGYTWGYTTYKGKNGWFVTDFAKKVTVTTAPTTAPTSAPTTAPTTAPAPAGEKESVARAVPRQQSSEQAMNAAPMREYMMGDMDADGDVTIMDATRIQLVLAELLKPNEYMMAVGDYDGDNVFSIMDSGRICRYLAYDKI